MKLNALIKDIQKEKIFGVVDAVIYTIEFQKRGLPHAHILIFLSNSNPYPNPKDIDMIISAEIPSQLCEPEYYQAVAEFMIHGPCGAVRKNSPCMINVDFDGYPIYRRRDNGRTVRKNGIDLDSRYVVPHNRHLLMKYRAHINVEWCNQSRSIKYLFKYISPPEAGWRIFAFDIQFRNPSVERLSFHLPNEQSIIFLDDDLVNDVVNRPTVAQSMFTAWFEANKKCLLNIVRGPTSFDEIKQVDGVQYSSFRDACYARGLIKDDKEYVDAITEAATWSLAHSLRKLFVTLLTSNSMSKPENVWEMVWQYLSDDAQYISRRNLSVSDENNDWFSGNRLLFEEMSYDREDLLHQHNSLHLKLTDEQLVIYNKVMADVETEKGGMYFVYGYGGTGKTFLWKTISAAIRSKGEIVLNVASSGIASLLLPGGRTAHSRKLYQLLLMKIPLATSSKAVHLLN
ncbi:PREDICTED: uncharacterized protein LOC109162437 [Ipomoea nil]|uniref:uncharacterized protein LOC109162437 n=1 Tax=Ipomoea nil TaxID=35883 RepID=UPI000900BE0F|nr:PREDICTED: uncharacterized protein LOC109162437 [Ipomoea nil]